MAFSPLFVMSPHSEDLDGSYLFQDLIDETVLDIDPTRIGSGKVSDQLFKGWRGLKRIFGQDGKLPGLRPGLPGKEITFLIVPLDPT